MGPQDLRAPGRRLAGILAGVALLALLAPAARAADLETLDTSLKIIPADVAFYSSSLRLKEQFDAVAKSRAWAKLWALPSVQAGWKMLENEYKPGGKLADVQAFFADEANKELLAVLAEAGSQEIFCYGGENWAGLFELLQKAYGAFQYGPLKAQLEGNAGGLNQGELQLQAVLRVLAKNPGLLKVPDLVIGARLADTKRAEKQLKRLEVLLNTVAAQTPVLKGRIKRIPVNDGSFLTLSLDGSLVPWDDLPIQNIEGKPGEFAPLVRQLKGMTLTVAIGVQQGYLMVSIGGTTEQLTRIGGRGAKLNSRPEFKPLTHFADRKLTSVGYASKDLMSRLASGQDYDALVDLIKTALPHANLQEAQEKRILKDVDDLVKELKTGVPEIGGTMSFSFLTERGYEGYAYNYTKEKGLTATKPLTLLEHVGGNPILAALGRSKVDGAGYAAFSKWVKVFYGHADDIVRDKLNGNDKDQYVKVTERLVPLFKKLDETTAKQFIPAVADGQWGFVLDAKWSSKQWVAVLPPTEKALPLPEIAVVLGVSDPVKLRRAMSDYIDTVNDGIGTVRALVEKAGAIGDFQIPAPQSVKRGAATLYFYPLPDAIPLDRRIVPTAGLSQNVAALTLSHDHAERLLKPTPLKVDGGPLSDAKKPLIGAVYFNWPALVDAAAPWVEIATHSILDKQDVPEKGRDEILDQVRTVLTVLKVYRGTTSATYLEDGAVVTHSETVIKDLEK
jgi:hypothetical protein